MLNKTLPNCRANRIYLLRFKKILLFLSVIVLAFDLSAQPFTAPPIVKSNKLFDVIRTGDAKQLEQQLANGASANDSLNSYSALMAATLNGTVEQMKILIDHGANVNYQTTGGITALWLAVPDWDKTMFLLNHGANVQQRVENFGILVKVAMMPGSVKILQLLIDKGADPKKSADDNYVLYSAALGGDTTIIALLLKYGLKPADTVSFGDYPLSAALNYRHYDAAKMLIDHGADVNSAGKNFQLKAFNGLTPLMFAALSDDKPSFYYLLDHGANTNMKSNMGFTALILLQQSETDDPDMTLALIKHGAKVSEKAIDGTDAMYYAKRKGNAKSVEILKKYTNQ